MITVLLTTYNSARYISDTIKSVLNQTFNNFELLIIDDGSTDETERAVSNFDDKRIRYIKIKHVGRSAALNFGLKNSKYEWVALIDSGDLAHPQRLEKQFLSNLKKNDVVITSCVYFRENKLLFKIDVNNLIFPQDLVLHQPFPNSVIFNKNFILENGGYDETISVAEDYELWTRIMNKTNFIIVDDVLMFYRFNQTSLSRNNPENNNATIYKIQEKYYKDLEHHFGITDKKKQNIFRGWREYFFGSPSIARKYWGQSAVFLKSPRIFLAYLISFLPNRYIEKIKQNEIKLKLKYFFEKVLGENQNTRILFRETIALLNRDMK